MATVLHGRRKGESRGNSAGDVRTQLPELAKGPNILNGTDLRQVTVLSKGDWDRIQMQLNRRVLEEEKQRKAKEEKDRLHNMCKEQVKNWGNTIAGQRQRKLEARKLREEREEEERKLVDIEEAKFQAQKRREAIDKAKTQQYYQTDRVKGFHGALLLTEVLKEREAQIELKRLKEQSGKGQDKEWFDQTIRDYDESILVDQKEATKRISKARDVAEFQKSMIGEHLQTHKNELEDDKIEGEQLKRLAAHYELEKKRLEEIKVAEAMQLMSDNLQQISEVKKIREIHKAQDEEEDEECRIFAAAKKKKVPTATLR